jgi:hypothetical protein
VVGAVCKAFQLRAVLLICLWCVCVSACPPGGAAQVQAARAGLLLPLKGEQFVLARTGVVGHLDKYAAMSAYFPTHDLEQVCVCVCVFEGENGVYMRCQALGNIRMPPYT